MKKLVVASFALLVIAGAIPAADWPQWLGPNRDGSTTETLPVWKSLRVVWRVPVAEGHSSPVVAGNKVILHTSAGKELEDPPDRRALVEHVVAYDAKTGEVQWAARMDRKPFSSQFGNGPRATPSVANGRVYCFGVTGTAAIFDVETGKLLADPVDLVEEFKAKVPFFGVSAAPLVESGKVYYQVGGPEAGVVALDAKTGKLLHKYLKGPASYAAPIATGRGAMRHIVVFNAEGLFGLPLGEGEPLWKFRFKDLMSESSTTPIRSGDILVASSVTLGAVGLKFEPKDGRPSVREVWRNPALSCYFSTPVAVGDSLYMVTGRMLAPQATLHCVETATGKIRWSKPKVGTYGATLVRLGDGKLLLLEEQGDLVLFQPDNDKYVELARGKLCGETWAHPAVADGRIYIRDRKELICAEPVP